MCVCVCFIERNGHIALKQQKGGRSSKTNASRNIYISRGKSEAEAQTLTERCSGCGCYLKGKRPRRFIFRGTAIC